MAAKDNAGPSKLADLKPGSSVEDAKKVVSKGDFGVHVDNRVGREYTSQNTRLADPGHASARSGEEDGVRVAGAGANDSGPGSSSGGDIDTDFVGIGGVGMAGSPSKEHRDGADDSDGTSREFASGGPAKGENQTGVGKIGGNHEVKGHTIGLLQQTDDRDNGPQGADAASYNENPVDSSFVGEISASEADGRDQAGDDDGVDTDGS
ncbi:MAG TPA: hypothetical protein VGB55_05745 [Tepidisphaeraceae bacterium]|jgi:hypothetical protein